MRNISLGLEDYFMIIATCMVTVSTVVVILSMTPILTVTTEITCSQNLRSAVTNGGVGLHATQVTLSDIEFNLKMIIVCQALYGTGLALVKTSMMILYHKLFGTKSSMRIAIYATGAIVWAWALSIILESFFLCHPVEYNWNPMLQGGGCGNRNAAFVVAGVLNMFTDLLVMSLPIPYIWKLQLPVGRRIGLSVAFSLGLFVSAISMVRVVSLMHINFKDVTYTLPIPLMWSIVEEQLAIVTANLPLLRRVFSSLLSGNWLGSSSGGMGTPSGEINGVKRSTQNYSLTRVDVGANRSVITSHNTNSPNLNNTRWSDDGQSDTELAANGMPPDGIQMWKEFRVDSNR
ncbi:hypothetical protein N7520_011016 [Penicillium odoratum]|uniref:uncharacterized protein n=1 Tax=Penicillium odoratum TaxID=1167516 RepID=UPI002549AB56|nr:uncharacterized protein N7520_011016 [Penicillium odoratum]KAJ5745834.1 hypothetical protein N7520_011016 [Penicillium odoratum]